MSGVINSQFNDLVVDACVAISASINEENAVPSTCSRKFLEEIEKLNNINSNGPMLVMVKKLKAEWNPDNLSPFSRKWLVRMETRLRVRNLSIPDDLDAILIHSIRKTTTSTKAIKAMLKDAHLLGAALVSDRTIISLDDEARNLFKAYNADIDNIKDIVWVNPCEQNTDSLNWLDRGAPADEHRKLGYIQ